VVVPRLQTVSVSLVEDAKQANIVFAKQVNGTRDCVPEPIVQFGVDTAGFDLECIDLSYAISPDLILQIAASSRALGTRKVLREYGKLRFSYRVK
jgi:hypothetical protein